MKNNYFYTQILTKQIQIYQSFNFLEPIQEFTRRFEHFVKIDLKKVKSFLKALQEIHCELLTNKLNELKPYKSNCKIVFLSESGSLVNPDEIVLQNPAAATASKT